MALKDIKNYIKRQKLEKEIDELVKEKLGENHIESYIFTHKRLKEWGRWACGPDCLDLVGQGIYTDSEVLKFPKKIADEFIRDISYNLKKDPDLIIMPLVVEKGIEITQLVKGFTFQPAKGNLKSSQGSRKMVAKLRQAKEAALQQIKILARGGTALRKDKTDPKYKVLGDAMSDAKSALHGHHGGSGADIELEPGRIIPPTTAGAEIARDRFRKIGNKHTGGSNPGFKSRPIEDMKDDAIQLTKDEILFDIVATSLLDWFDHTLNLTRSVTKVTQMGETFTLPSDRIYVDFALGSGPIGKANTAYRSKWDANKTDGVTQRINNALKNISTDIEKFVVKHSLQNQGNLAALRASPSAVDNIQTVGGNRIVTILTKKLPKTKVTKKLVKPKIPKKANYKGKPKRTRVSAAILLNKNKKHGKRTRTSSQDSSSSPQATVVGLRELLNQQLPERLLANMGSPALNNQTGRFRHSAEVVNVIRGPRGGTEVQYTYRKDPYKMYEPGGERGSTYRDPRRLIGGTIRELASEMMRNKFIKIRSV